jgi:hypothetical protein
VAELADALDLGSSGFTPVRVQVPSAPPLDSKTLTSIRIAFLAYCLTATLKHRLQAHAPGLSTRAVLEKLAAIQTLGRLAAHDRRSLPGGAALHRAGTGSAALAAPTETRPPPNNPFHASSALQPTPCLNSKCSADLGGASTENEQLPGGLLAQVGKSG